MIWDCKLPHCPDKYVLTSFSIQPPQWEKPIYYVNTGNTTNFKCYADELMNTVNRGLPTLTKASQENVEPTSELYYKLFSLNVQKLQNTQS